MPVNVTGTSGIAFTAAVATTSGGAWLSAAVTSPTPGSVSVGIVTSALTAAGTYSGTVTISEPNATSQVITVTIVVSNSLSVSSNSLNFTYTLSGTAPTAVPVNVTGTSGIAFTAAVATTSGGAWLSAVVTSPMPGSVSVGIVTSALTAAGTYNGTVTVSAANAKSQVINVSIVVSSNLTVSTSTLNFTYTLGAPAPTSQSFNVGGTSGLVFTATAATKSGGSWLSAVATSPTPGSVNVSINTSGLAAGSFTGTVTVASAGLTSQVVNVNLTVTAPALTASPTSLTFNFALGGTTPAAQPLNILGGSGLAYTASAGAAWLSVSSGASGTLPSVLSISVNTASLTAGTYQSSITITATGASNSPFAIPVTFKVSSGTSTITVSPSSLSFSATIGGTAPASQSVNVTGSTATGVTISSIGGSWLSASISASTTPAVITVSTSQANLTAGTYTGTVVVTAKTASDSPQNIAVSLVVSSATLTANPTSLSFTATPGSTSTPAQTINITSTGASTLSISTANGPWLTVVSSSTTTPATLTVGVDTSSLTAGTYNATISIASAGATNSPLILPIALVVSAKPKLAASPTSLTFTTQTGAANPASQSIALSGSSALPLSATASPSWLSVSLGASTTPSTLVVNVNSKGMTAGSYQGTITITSTGASNTPVIIPVTLSVSAPLVTTGPSITAVVSAASYAASGFAPGAIVSIFGTQIGPKTGTSFSVNSKGSVDDTLAGVGVTVGGLAATPLFAQEGQVNVILPFNLATTGQANVEVAYNNVTSGEFNITLEPADVQIFTANASGSGPGSILNQDYSVNSSTNGAAPNSVVQVFGTGGGVLVPPVTAGDVAGDTLSWVALQYSATVNGENATVLYAGSAPGLVYGVYQFNVQLPADVQPGPAIIVLTVGGSTSQTDVTVYVK